MSCAKMDFNRLFLVDSWIISNMKFDDQYFAKLLESAFSVYDIYMNSVMEFMRCKSFIVTIFVKVPRSLSQILEWYLT